MGSRWKMPTKDQFQELIDNTTSIWTTINGYIGRKLTSKSNSNKYIFFPACAGWDHTNYNGVGTYGAHWSVTCKPSLTAPYAWYIRFDSSRVFIDNYYRRAGFPIRPVR